jgi:hypothetical protein
LDEPKKLASTILECDESLEWVTVANDRGEPLSNVRSPRFKLVAGVDRDTKIRLGVLDAVTLRAYSRTEGWYGTLQYALLAYDKALVLLVRDRKHKLLFAIKTQRSQNPEYLFAKVKEALGD